MIFVIICGGINNLTHIHTSGRITPRYQEVGNLMYVITTEIHDAKSRVTQSGFRVMIAQLMGVDINMYNSTTGEYPVQ